MNFSRAAFYKLDEGAGTSVADTLGNAPAGTIVGEATNLWANAGCMTESKAAGAAGDNAIKLIDPYFDELMRLDTLEGSSLLFMYWLNQPQVPATGTRFLFTYGDILSTVDGGYGCTDAQGHVATYSIRDVTTWQSGVLTVTEPMPAAENGNWMCFGIQFDLYDGRLVIQGNINGHPNRAYRLFNLESALPRADSSGAGLRLFGRGTAGGGSNNYLFGQTQVKRAFIGRTNGDMRHRLPIWQREFYEQATGVPDWMVS